MSPFSGACPLQCSEAPVAAEAAGAGPVRAGLGLVDLEGAVLEVPAVERSEAERGLPLCGGPLRPPPFAVQDVTETDDSRPDQ